jgi:galactokinase
MNFDLIVSSPGRICLFGEHQDYFGLAIVAGAIDLRITISGRRRADRKIHLDLPDIGEVEDINLDAPLAYSRPRDYLKSGVNVVRRAGVRLDHGWDCEVRGTIPINAGTSSSSALVVAWVKFLLEAASDPRACDADQVAELGFLTEVAEFKEPGGKMDHYASAKGQVVAIHFGDHFRLTHLRRPLGRFVLANSLQKKDTTGMLGFIKSNVLDGLAAVRRSLPEFSLLSPVGDEERRAVEALPNPDQRRLLSGTLRTRDLTSRGEDLFLAPEFDHREFGRLLSAQHRVLRDELRISTPKIESLMETALKAGAYGGKINGSGGGGCLFVYAPDDTERVARALEDAGGKPCIISIDEGMRRESP